MARQDIIPAVCKYVKMLSDGVVAKKQVGADVCCGFEEMLVPKLSTAVTELYNKLEQLDEEIAQAHEISDALKQAEFYRDAVLKTMEEVRAIADDMEVNTAKEYWPFPSYGDLLFSIQE